MGATTVVLIIIVLVMALFLFACVAVSYKMRKNLKQCQNNQSPFCYTISCSALDPTDQGKICNGYAWRIEGNKRYCSNTPFTPDKSY